MTEPLLPPAESNTAAPAFAPSALPTLAPPVWERQLIEKLLHGNLKEQKSKRRWGVFFKLCSIAMFGLVVATLASLAGWFDGKASPSTSKHTALIELSGEINIDGESSADAIGKALRAAFKDENTAGIVMRVNSPGGSPVQSGLIYEEMRRLKAAHPTIPLYVVVEELCASGGYYIAAAADKIYVDKASLVGSIGVIMDGYGFTGLMEKAGVERRLITAGSNKALLDMFSPVNEDQKKFAQQMVAEIHQQFIAAVKAGRGDRLKNDPDIFTGLVWTGARSISLGLADELGSVDSVARDVIKAEEIVDFTSRENFAQRIAKRVGASFGKSITAAMNASLIAASQGTVRLK